MLKYRSFGRTALRNSTDGRSNPERSPGLVHALLCVPVACAPELVDGVIQLALNGGFVAKDAVEIITPR